MSVSPKPPATVIRIPVEGPIELRWENCRTAEDRERVILWIQSVPELADVFIRAFKIYQAERNVQ